MIPPRFSVPIDSDYDEASTQTWIHGLPDSAIQRIAHARHECVDNALHKLLEEEWWKRHAKRLDDWPTIELATPIALKAIMFCGERGDGRESLPPLLASNPFDPKHQPSRMLPFGEEGDDSEYWIECACGWKESQGPEPQLHRVGDWWWPTVTHWDDQDLDGPKLLICRQASTPYDVTHAPKNYVRSADLAEATEEAGYVPASRKTINYHFTKCICGARPYWPDHFRLHTPTDEELSYLGTLEKGLNAQSNQR